MIKDYGLHIWEDYLSHFIYFHSFSGLSVKSEIMNWFYLINLHFLHREFPLRINPKDLTSLKGKSLHWLFLMQWISKSQKLITSSNTLFVSAKRFYILVELILGFQKIWGSELTLNKKHYLVSTKPSYYL